MIETIFIGQNNIGDNGAQAVQKFLSSFSHIKYLDISENNITNTGAKYLGIGIGKNRSLLSISIRWNPVNNIGAEYIGKGLRHAGKSLKFIGLTGTEIDKEGILRMREESSSKGDKHIDFDLNPL